VAKRLWDDMSEEEASARRREIALLTDNAWFERDWYRAQNSDLGDMIDPVEHFVLQGWREGRDPGPRFSVQWYQAAYPDVPMADLNPLIHFLDNGMAEGRFPHPNALNSSGAVVAAVSSDGPQLPLALTQREAEDIAMLRVHPQFDAAWYTERNPDITASGLSPPEHFVLFGGFEGRSPGPDFDLLEYLDGRDDIEQLGVNAFVHFVRHGENNGAAGSRPE